MHNQGKYASDMVDAIGKWPHSVKTKLFELWQICLKQDTHVRET